MRHLLPLLCAALMLGAGACSFGVAASPTPTPIAEPPAPAAETFRVQRGLVTRAVEFSARVQPREFESLSFGVDGRVRRAAVRTGDAVKQGDVLIELDLADLRTQLDQAVIQLRTAQSVLSDTLSAYTRTVQLARLDLQQAQLRLDTAKARVTAGGQRVIVSDLARNAQLIDDLKRIINDARQRYNQALADDAEKRLRQAEADREKLQASLDSLTADARARQFEIANLELDVERARLSLDAKESSLDPRLIQAVESAAVNVDALRAKIANGQILAPFDGTVTYQTVSVGDNVRALDPVVAVAKPGELEIVAELQADQIILLSPGQRVDVRLTGGGRLNGVIRSLPFLGPTSRDRLVRITVDNPAGLESGALARVSAELSRAENALWVPPQAVRSFRGRAYVVVQDPPGGQRRVDVKVGVEGNDRTELIDGVSEGEVVVSP